MRRTARRTKSNPTSLLSRAMRATPGASASSLRVPGPGRPRHGRRGRSPQGWVYGVPRDEPAGTSGPLTEPSFVADPRVTPDRAATRSQRPATGPASSARSGSPSRASITLARLRPAARPALAPSARRSAAGSRCGSSPASAPSCHSASTLPRAMDDGRHQRHAAAGRSDERADVEPLEAHDSSRRCLRERTPANGPARRASCTRRASRCRPPARVAIDELASRCRRNSEADDRHVGRLALDHEAEARRQARFHQDSVEVTRMVGDQDAGVRWQVLEPPRPAAAGRRVRARPAPASACRRAARRAAAAAARAAPRR